MKLPDNMINIPQIIKILGRSFSAHSRVLSYLGYEGKSFGNTVIYPVECVDALRKFYEEHSNPKAFFFSLSCMERYGVSHVSKSPSIKEKKRNTTRKNYGVDYPAQNDGVKGRIRDTNINRYGNACSLHGEEVQRKVIDTNKVKYGHDNPMQNQSVKERLCESNLRKFGNRSSLHGLNQLNISIAKENAIKENRKSLEEKFGRLYTLNELSAMFDRDITTISKVIINLGIEKIKGKVLYVRQCDCDSLKDYFSSTENSAVSFAERTLGEFLSSVYKGKIIFNDRSVLGNNRELDIYVPEMRVAIEFDGLYWHSELPLLKQGLLSEEEKEIVKYRHLRKTDECSAKGIRLIHIFEDEWTYSRDICKSIILSALGIYKEKIYARKCSIRELSRNEFDDFMLANHIQGTANTHHRIGLFHDGLLVQCMGFIRNAHRTGETELNRMATALNTQVLGGFSRLLFHAVELYGFDEIYSYVANRLYDGKGYNAVGFFELYRNEPTYFYVRNALRRYPRYDFQRKKIEAKFNEGELKYWNPSKTEEVNMWRNGFGRIWDCGTTKVAFKKKNR